ncbi:MAG: hypothetical protein R2822_19045 [Spirosomataceae bacterium]
MLLLVVVGNGSIENGFRKIIAIFNMKVADWRAIWHQTKTNIWWNRIPLAVNLIILMIVATVMSVSIDLWVHLGLFGWLKSNHLLSEMATYLPLASLLKCLSVVLLHWFSSVCWC